MGRRPLDRVLLVDDEDDTRVLLRLHLEAEECDAEVVGEARNGVEALSQVARLLPDVVITNVRMPVMDGIEATRGIKSSFPQVEVIVFTSGEDPAEWAEVRGLGASVHAKTDLDGLLARFGC